MTKITDNSNNTRMINPTYLSIEEISIRTGENSETLRKRCQSGAIDGAVIKGKTWVIPKSYIFKVKVDKPNIPLIWLDTWVILRLTRAVKTDTVSREEKEWGLEVFKKITSLTDRKKVLCPEADQGLEIETGNRLVNEAREFQTQISRGIALHPYQSVEDLQIQRIMKAYVNHDDEVILPWRDDLFFDDPIRELSKNSPYLVNVHFDPSKEELNDRIKTNRSISDDWEALRLESRKNREKFEARVRLEQAARGNLIMRIAANLVAKRIHKKEVSTHELLQAMDIMGKPLAWWEHDGKQAENFFGLIQFYLSEEFKRVPAVDISTQLVSKLLTDDEKIRPSDVMDVNQIAAVLPYAHYMVLDGPMRDKIVDKLKLDKKYVTKILRWRELSSLLDNLG